MSFYEINCNNLQADIDTGRIKKNSPVVEVFSALTSGKTPNVDGKVLDKAVATLSEMASKAMNGDPAAISEINTIIRLSIEPKLLDQIQLFNFIGNYKTIGYKDAAMMKTYRYESVDSRWQAGSGDVPFASYSWREYPIATQTISGGFAVDYREIESGNFDGSIAEGMAQVQIDMRNKCVYYVIAKMYEALKNAKGVKHFAESAGVTKAGVDDLLKVMRRYGQVSIMGDYSVISQMNEFVGYKPIGEAVINFGSDTVAEEIRKTGLISWYNGANVVEIPNAYNWTMMNADKSAFELYLPQGLLFFVPRGAVSPIQIFNRGGMTTMTGDDIVTRQHLTRFDMEIGAGVAEGMEHQIGLLSDTNFEVPSL